MFARGAVLGVTLSFILVGCNNISSERSSGVINFYPNGPVNLGNVVVGSSGLANSFSVLNSGSAITSCSDAVLSGANASEFMLNGASSCKTGIAASGTCSGLSVLAQPQLVGAKSASLTLVCGKFSSTVTLTATATSSAPTALAPSGLSYPMSSITATKGVAISANSPTSSGGAITSYALKTSPTSTAQVFPAGLSLNATTGVISGTPSVILPLTSFSVLASNSAGYTTTTISLVVNDVAPSALSYTQSTATYPVNVAIANNSPSSSGGPVVSYSASSLPAGLSLNQVTGIISGTPTSIGSGTYTITASNSGGVTTKALTLGVVASIPTQTNVTFNAIPFSDPDLVAPARGAHYWLGTTGSLAVEIPIAGLPEQSLDHFARFKWGQIESDTGVYSFTRFNAEINSAITAGRKFDFSIMSMCPPTNCSGTRIVDGFSLSYPLHIHAKMQAETVKDWGVSNTAEGSFWVPNWNSPAYLLAWEKMLLALAAHIETGSYNGIRYKDVIGRVDVRGFGMWGEWHNYPWDACNCTPAGTNPSAASLIRIVNSHITAFPNFQLIGLLGGFAATSISSRYIVPDEASCHLATVKNNFGEIGWRRDNWGTNASWILGYVDNNPVMCNGVPLKTLIMNKWKKAPIIGEPNGSATTAATGGDCAFYDLVREVQTYHASGFGNGNWGGGESIPCAQTYIRAASKLSGYRLQLNAGSYTSTVGSNKTLNVQLAWRNVGIAPVYETWNVVYQLKNFSGSVVWTGSSSMILKLFLPETSDRIVNDAFVIPSTLASGYYSLSVVIKDPTNYRKPLPLAILGRAADGSYLLGDVVVQ